MKKILILLLLLFTGLVGVAQTPLDVSRQELTRYNFGLDARFAIDKTPDVNTTRRFFGNLTTDTLIAKIQENFATTIGQKAPINNPTFTGTVSGITKSMVGLGNVDNTSDANKPVSTATQTALDLKAPLSNPVFLSSVTLPSNTVIGAVTSTQIGYLSGVSSNIQTQFSNKVDKVTGYGLSKNDLTDAYKTSLDNLSTNFGLKANLAAPSFTGIVQTGSLKTIDTDGISITTNGAFGTLTTPKNMSINFLGYANNTNAIIKSIDISGDSFESSLIFSVRGSSGSSSISDKMTVSGNGIFTLTGITYNSNISTHLFGTQTNNGTPNQFAGDINAKSSLYVNSKIGIGTTSPTSTLHNTGSEASGIVSISGATTLADNYYVIANGSSTYLVTLPAASTCVGRTYAIKTLTANKTISAFLNASGSSTTTLTAGTILYIVSDGTNWQQF